MPHIPRSTEPARDPGSYAETLPSNLTDEQFLTVLNQTQDARVAIAALAKTLREIEMPYLATAFEAHSDKVYGGLQVRLLEQQPGSPE